MSRRLARSFVALLLLIVVLNSSVLACGPFTTEAIFVHHVHPTYPLERFAEGQLGVVQPDYARSYLYVAYRYLSGSTFNAAEQKELVSLWRERLGYESVSESSNSASEWLKLRKQVPGLPEITSIEVWRAREKPNDYDSFLNCQDDSFATASEALKTKLAKSGAQDASVKSWVEAQDVVFSNCSGGKNIPTAVDASADSQFRSERDYQIAAANFYATNFDEAVKGFDAIANDTKSPWHTTAPYLAGRTFLRKASLGPEDARNATFSQAEDQFKKVLADKQSSALHPSAQRLLNLVRFRLHPAERRSELAASLLSKKANEDLRQQLWDYTYLLDKMVDTETDKPTMPKTETDDLTDWIFTFQSEEPDALERSLSRWQATKTTCWLISALAKIEGTNPRTAELIDQALAIKSNDIAYTTARFHAVRLLTSTGKHTQARTIVDQMIASKDSLDQSSINLFTGQKMKLANNLAEFLKYAPRVPAALSWNDDGRELPSDDAELPDETKNLRGRPRFDYDAANVLNHQMPLAMRGEAVNSNSLPADLQRDLTQATWLRATMLGDFTTADDLVSALKSQVPEMSGLLSEYSTSATPDAKLFAALYAWLKFPGLEPVVDVGVGRTTPLNEQDSYRDNWWCTYGAADEAKPAYAPVFLTAAQLAAAKKEAAALDTLGPGPNYLCKQVIQWSTRNPNDPRNAEALHLAVLTTRFGCTDKESGRWSKAAFDLLHRKYPTSTWAKKTPYWFKE
jgi:hypothetical protein